MLPELSAPADRLQHEIAFQVALGMPLAATKGYGALEVESAYMRARELCRQLGDPLQLFPVLSALALFYLVRGALQNAQELGEQLVQLAAQSQESTQLLEADYLFGVALFCRGQLLLGHQHIQAMITRYDADQSRNHVFCCGEDPRIQPVSYQIFSLFILGDADQARAWHQEMMCHAQANGSPYHLACALHFSSSFYYLDSRKFS